MIFVKIHRLKPQLITVCKVGVLLALCFTISGCGNKGDLYHPEEATVSQVNQNTMPENNEQARLPI